MTDVLPLIENHVLAFLLFVAIVGGVGVLVYAQFKHDKFDLRALIVDPKTKQPSIHQLGQVAALGISSWGFIVLVLHGNLTEVYFTTYMGIWAGANALDKFLNRGRSDDGRPRDEPQGSDNRGNANSQ